jgi:hypothetical protein
MIMYSYAWGAKGRRKGHHVVFHYFYLFLTKSLLEEYCPTQRFVDACVKVGKLTNTVLLDKAGDGAFAKRIGEQMLMFLNGEVCDF